MKKISLLIACVTTLQNYAQQVIFNNSFDNLSLQTYTTSASSVKYTTVPGGFSVINDGRKNNVGSLNNPNKPFNDSTLKTIGWAVVYNALDNDTFLVSTSWLDTTGVNVDRWVVTPLISNIAANSVLTWLAKSPDASYPDGYEVYGTTNTGNLTSQSFAIGDRLFVLNDGNTAGGGEKSVWARRSVNLSSFAGQSLRFAFRNNSKDMYQLWIDDIQVLTPNVSLDGLLTPSTFNKYKLINTSDSVLVNFQSLGAAAITTVNLSYQIGNSTVNTENFTFTSGLGYGQAARLKFGLPYTVSQPGYYTVKTWINSVNGAADQNLTNDTLRYYVTVQNSAPARSVLVEQFTSANNEEGPDAQGKLMDLQFNSAIVVNIHHQDSLVEPGSLNLINDYKKEFATALIDRVYHHDLQSVTVARSFYAGRNAVRKNAVSPVSVSIINKSYNTATRELSFTVKADFVGEVKGDYRINAYLTENQVHGDFQDTTVNGYNQLNGLYDVPWAHYYLMGYYAPLVNAYVLNADQYKHHNTLVHSFHGSYGNAGLIPSTGGTQGQSYQQTFTLSVPDYTNGVFKFKEDNLYLVGFVSEYSTDKNQRTVLNAVKEKLNGNDEVVGVKELKPSVSVSIYPNPTSGELYIDASSLEGNSTFSLYEVLGKKILQGSLKVGNSIERIDLLGIAAGIYFLKVTSGKQSVTEKVIIRKN